MRTGKCPNLTNKAPVATAIIPAGKCLDVILHAVIKIKVATANMIASGWICAGFMLVMATKAGSCTIRR